MASIEEVRAGIDAAKEKASESLGALQQALPGPSRMAGVPARPIPTLLSPRGPVLALAD